MKLPEIELSRAEVAVHGWMLQALFRRGQAAAGARVCLSTITGLRKFRKHTIVASAGCNRFRVVSFVVLTSVKGQGDYEARWVVAGEVEWSVEFVSAQSEDALKDLQRAAELMPQEMCRCTSYNGDS